MASALPGPAGGAGSRLAGHVTNTPMRPDEGGGTGHPRGWLPRHLNPHFGHVKGLHLFSRKAQSGDTQTEEAKSPDVLRGGRAALPQAPSAQETESGAGAPVPWGGRSSKRFKSHRA